MAENLSPLSHGESPVMERRPSKNPIKNIMRHLTVEPPEDDDGSPRRESLIRRLSRRSSRSPSAHSDASAPASATPRNQDPTLCPTCTSLAADIEYSLEIADVIFAKTLDPAAEDAFDDKEYFVAQLRGLEEDKWSTTCPLCKLFWAVHVSGKEDYGNYCLSAFSSRDTNYLIDSTRMFDMDHPARGSAKGLAPAFLAVVPKKHGDDSKTWDVNPESFRETGMLLRTLPQASLEAESLAPTASPRGRSRSNDRCTPEPPAILTDSSWLQKGIWGREIGQQADLSIARNWLQFCGRHHQARCGGRRPAARDLPGFKLIDCMQSPPRVVERPLGDDYVALSYVCGKESLPAWPSVVRDAIVVTVELGVRYLWMDRLCIDSADIHERTGHVLRMDEIFEGALVTIIAAHGHDATQGLPGVGSTPRPEQPKYKFTDGDVTLVSSLRDPRLDIKDSVWYTRGWTYQEGLLPRRRLIFTERQMYWECEGMSCPETLVLPLANHYDRQQEKMCDFVKPGLFNCVSFLDGSWEAWKRLPQVLEEPSTLSIFRQSDQHIVEYTKRALTRNEDSLNAFIGITRRLEKTLGNRKLASIVGIPLWTPQTPVTARRGPARTKLLFALATSIWHHVSDDQQRQRPRRRRHLPSWTWAGWQGAVELHSSIVVRDHIEPSKERRVLNHHYVAATQLTRNDMTSVKWSYSPDMVVLTSEGQMAYDFSSFSLPTFFSPGRYMLRVANPYILDKVKARVHEGTWLFNDLCVDVRLSRGRGTDAPVASAAYAGEPSAIREYLESHASGQRMTVLWFIEEGMILLLVVEKTQSGAAWERVGRARLSFRQDVKDVVRRFGSLEAMMNLLPLRRLGEDLLIE